MTSSKQVLERNLAAYNMLTQLGLAPVPASAE
jgi:hypothetical protein